MPTVVPYTDPQISPNVGTPWPQMAQERIDILEGAVRDLNYQTADLNQQIAVLRQQTNGLTVGIESKKRG